MKKWFICSAGISVGLLAVYLVTGVRAARDAAQHVMCNGRLSLLGLAMHNYHAKYGSFPPAYVLGIDGRPWHSWRVLLLEFLDQTETYHAYKFDEPWDGPNNRKLAGSMPRCFACPGDDTARVKHETNYFVVVGPRTAFPGSRAVKLGEIAGPKSSKILLVEAVDQGVNWMQPKDLSFDSMSFILNDVGRQSVSSRHHHSPMICMVDGSRTNADSVSLARFKEMFLVDSVDGK